jgi:signal peptidase I
MAGGNFIGPPGWQALRAGLAGSPLRWLLPLLLLVLACRQWIGMPILITGGSMQPTLRSGQLAAINRLAYHFGPPRRGDIVVVHTGRERIVKRIVGLPGEEIAVRNGVFFIDGRPLAEPYVLFAGTDNITPGRLGRNRFVVAGDYRLGGMIAIVNRDRILGRLVFWQ